LQQLFKFAALDSWTRVGRGLILDMNCGAFFTGLKIGMI